MANRRLQAVLRHVRQVFADPVAGRVSDRQLLERFTQNRDEVAFASIVKRHGPLVLGVARRLLHNRQDAEDVLQATFLVMARKAGSRHWQDSVAGWLYQVAFRLAARMNARKARQNMLEQERGLMPKSVAMPDQDLEELHAVLDEELQGLPDKYREPLLLCYLEGQTRDQAAEKLGWSVRTLHNRIQQGLKLLRCRLTRRGIGLPTALLMAGLSHDAASAAVSSALAAAIAKVSVAFAAGSSLAGADMAVTAAALAEKAVKAMVVARIKAGLAVLLAVGLAVSGAGVVAHQALAARQQANAEPAPLQPDRAQGQPARPEPTKPLARVDRSGDPLPQQALWRLGTLRFRHPGWISQLAVAPHGNLLAASGNDVVVLWDMRTGREVRRFEGGSEGVAFSPNGRILAAVVDTGFQRQGIEIRRWDMATGEELPRYRAPLWQCQLSFSPDGRVLTCLGGEQQQKHVTIVFLDATTGKELHRFVHPCRWLHFAFAPNSRTFACVDLMEKSIRIADISTGKVIRLLQGHAKAAWTVAFSPDGKTLASTDEDHTLRFWDVATGKILPRQGKFRDGRFWARNSLAYSPDGALLASSGPILYDVNQRKQLPILARTSEPVPVQFSPDGKLLIFAEERAVRLFDISTGKLVHEFAGHYGSVSALAFSRDGRTLFSAAGEGGMIHRWETATGKELDCWDQLKGSVYGLAMSPDGRILAAGTANWNDDAWLLESATGTLLRKLIMPDGDAISVTFSGDGRTLLGRNWEHTRLWDAATGKAILTFPGSNPRRAFGISPDGRMLAVSDAGSQADIHLLEVPGGKEAKTLRGHFGWATDVQFSPDGTTLASCGGRLDKSIRLWDIGKGAELWRAEANYSWLRFSPDGRTLAGGGADGVVQLWETVTGKVRGRLDGHRQAVRIGVFSPDSRLLATGSEDTTILLWQLATFADGSSAPSARGSEFAGLWSDLASVDAARAYRAVWAMVNAGDKSVLFLRSYLKPAGAAGSRQSDINRWISELGSDQFAVREKVTRALESIGDVCEPALRKALRTNPTLEVARRIRLLLNLFEGWSPERLREWRALEVLETTGSPEAKRLLDALARGNPDARLTQRAKATLDRLGNRSDK